MLIITNIKLFITIYIFLVDTLTYILYHKGKPQNRLATYRYNEYTSAKTQVFASLIVFIISLNCEIAEKNKFRRKL